MNEGGTMIEIFPRPDFLEIYGFEPNQYSKHWEASRIERVLGNLAQKTRVAEAKAWDAFNKIAGLISDIDLKKWHLDYRIAVADLERAVDEFYWSYLLAKRAGFAVKKALVDYLSSGHA